MMILTSSTKECIDKNFNLHIQALPSSTKPMSVRTLKGLTVVNSYLPTDTYNIIHIQNDSQLTLVDLQTAVRQFISAQLPFCFWLSQTVATQRVIGLLQKLGANTVGKDPGMVLPLQNYLPVTDQHHQAIRIVKTPKELADFAHVVASNWTPPDKYVEVYYQQVESAVLSNSQNVFIVYYLDGQPVSGLELFPTDSQTVGIYSLATLQSFRGQGIGSSMMSYALNYVKELGYQSAVLQSSEDGYRIYEKLGFQEVMTYFEYQIT